jgi:protein ImuB
VVIRSIAQRRVVVDVSQEAQKTGIKPGMSAAEARALCLNLTCIDDDPRADRRALEALGRWLIRFTPLVARGWGGVDENQTGDEQGGYENRPESQSNQPPALFLDLTGCDRLFGGIARLLELIQAALNRFNIPARLAVAPTPGAAWAFAVTNGGGAKIVEASSLPREILPLPVVTLRLEEAVVADLIHLGLLRVGDLLALPREQLPARFGPALLKRLDQLTGAVAEPLINLVSDPPIISRAEFDAPIEALEDIWLILERLLEGVVADLTRRNHGARQLRMVLQPDRGWGRPTVTRLISLSRPHRNRRALLELIRCETQRIDCEHGFVVFQLDVPLHESISDAQIQLFEQGTIERQIELDRLIERLRVRLGAPAVIQPALVESYLPESAWQPATDDQPPASALKPAKKKTPLPKRAPAKTALPKTSLPKTALKELSKAALSADVTVGMPPRPLCLLPTPEEISVICEPSDDRTGHPRQFNWQGTVHRLAWVTGPERIAGQWWRGHHHTRDYYDVEDQAGRRFWIFRVLHLLSPQRIVARWFLHGRFD